MITKLLDSCNLPTMNDLTLDYLQFVPYVGITLPLSAEEDMYFF